MSVLDEIELSIDEFEALRLADLEGLYQEEAAARMEVSRATFARIVAASRKKVATALVQGNALRIGGGPVAFAGERSFRCESCRHDWTLLSAPGGPRGGPPARLGSSGGSMRGRARDPDPPAGGRGSSRLAADVGPTPD
jgi:predicted DNA-binding protein (UPF0251 family)